MLYNSGRCNESQIRLNIAGSDEQAKALFEEAATRSPENIFEHLKKVAKAWAGGSAQRDDVTFVVVKIKQKLSGSRIEHLTSTGVVGKAQTF